MGAITNFMSMLLDSLNGVIHNYGWSIIIFTILFRLVLMPLDIKSKIDMRKYQKQIAKLKPKLDAIEKKYSNDPQKKQQKTAELYKAENVSMLGGCKGCIPILLQYPLLIAFFAVFRNMAATYDAQLIKALGDAATHADCVKYAAEHGWNFLWISNIWQPDVYVKLFGSVKDVFLPNGYFVLPVLAGASQYIATLITPQSDPSAQQNNTMKFMQILLPLMFVYFTLVSSAALALYWVISNLVMMGSQFLVNKYLDAKEKKQEQSQGGNIDYEIH